jgi:hypothetical protein
MSNFENSFFEMLDNGANIFDISKFFGGVPNLIKKSEQYPRINSFLYSELSCTLSGTFEFGDDVFMFEIPAVVTDVEATDADHNSVGVNIEMPDVTDKEDVRFIYNWLDFYLQDYGAEAATFDSEYLNSEMNWVYISHFNGVDWTDIGRMDMGDIDESELFYTLPEEYFYPG